MNVQVFIVRVLCLLCVVASAMAADGDSKAVKLPACDGSRSKFHMWWMCFMAHAMFYKFSMCLKETAEADLPTNEAEASTDTQAEKDARKRNSLAMCSFTLAFQTDGLLRLIYKA